MKTSAYISTGTYLDTVLQTVFCREFDSTKDYAALQNVLRSKDAVERLIGGGDIEKLGSGEDISTILANTIFSEEGALPRKASSITELVWRLKGTTCDRIYHFASGTFENGGWFTLTPSEIKWFDGPHALSPGENWEKSGD